MRTTQTRWAALGAVVLLALSFAGCATNRAGAGPDESSDPVETSAPDDGAAGDPTLDVAAAWLGETPTLAIVTWGSSSCRPLVDSVSVDGQRIDVTLVYLENATACTRDFVPRGITVAPPAGLDVSKPVEIVLSGVMEARVELAGFSGEPATSPVFDEAPSATWSTIPGVALLLTYGSSSCLPIIDTVAAGTDGVIEVHFTTPDAEQVCTADFAPRITPVDTRAMTDVDPATTTTLVIRNGDSSFDITIAPPA